jgi:hypothetical protein
MKTPKALTEIALKHMIGHYGGMILLFLLKFSYILLALTVAISVPVAAQLGEVSGVFAFAFVLILFYILYQPLIICEGDILYSDISGKSKPISNIFNCYIKNEARKRTYEIATEVFLRKFAAGVPVLLTIAIIVYFTAQTVGILGEGPLTVFIIVSTVLTILSILFLYFVHTMRYIAVKYLDTLYKNMNGSQIVTFSVNLTKGKKNYIMSVYLRVIPFYILSLLIFPAMFTFPYIDTVKALIVKELIENYDNKVN